jgi:hypothetical protein
MTKEVTFEPVDGAINDRIDDAYRANDTVMEEFPDNRLWLLTRGIVPVLGLRWDIQTPPTDPSVAERAELVPGQNPVLGKRSAAEWFNTAAFSQNPSGLVIYLRANHIGQRNAPAAARIAVHVLKCSECQFGR